RVERSRERDELTSGLPVAFGVVEPARNVVSDPAEWLDRRSPQASPDVDGDGCGLLVGQLGDVGPRSGALDQHRAALVVAAQEPDGAVAVPERERLCLLVRLVVLLRSHLEDRVAGGRDVRVARECERRAEQEATVRCTPE